MFGVGVLILERKCGCFILHEAHFTWLQAYFLHSGSLCTSVRVPQPLQLCEFIRFGDRQSFYMELGVEAAQQ